ncbi:hypothetical protein DICPUDRAFT_93253 [Dictyostelium purpureum]|uniref:RRM domain-containing protein n=1 Tax=Dictyostelium purpureum TaxID=5786 RepID=F1A4N7_DICPU|nr:uncharacterized protein DICPUDRAFT_93253 [Dictyostelium purpureum]EGC28844.1 hypothetical protein DICPUDRAFT_93253 [Dictyostelium purpureum]|eukprot:XP_003294630.1 hypothetical protein DICPUDRAFT_93253 [Dictyostelium purpureum]
MSTETTNPTTPAFRIFVGNLTKNVEKEELEKAFAEFGKVLSVRIISKRYQENTFGFVDMEDLEVANKAIAAVNGKEIDGKAVTVELARERSTEKPKRTSTRRNSNRGPRRTTRPATNQPVVVIPPDVTPNHQTEKMKLLKSSPLPLKVLLLNHQLPLHQAPHHPLKQENIEKENQLPTPLIDNNHQPLSLLETFHTHSMMLNY